MKILVTGFESFHKTDINPTETVLSKLPDNWQSHLITTKVLPVVYGKAFNVLKQIIKDELPDVILLMGFAGKRDKLTIERVAINCRDASITDNALVKHIDSPINPHGKSAYFSTLKIRAITDAWNDMSIGASISNSAGTYVCNDLMYQTLEYIDEHNLNIPAGFVHVPSHIDGEELAQDTLKQAIIKLIDIQMRREG